MNFFEVKKAKRRKTKITGLEKVVNSTDVMNHKALKTSNFVECNTDADHVTQLMDDPLDDPLDAPDNDLLFNKGPNPYIEPDKCLLCDVRRTYVPTIHCDTVVGGEHSSRNSLENDAFDGLLVWVCQGCRQSCTGNDLQEKFYQDEELQPTAASSVSGEFGSFSTTTFSDTFSGKCCQCPSCNQCRQITAEYEKETTVLQLVWTSLRAMIRKLYCMEKAELSVEEADSFRQQIDKLCSRDPHQLFQRLESQVRVFVIEHKVFLRNKINAGFASQPESRVIMARFLEQYDNLSKVARIVSENLSTLKEHLHQFHVSWELHNKHLYHSIVYSEPVIHECLDALCEQLSADRDTTANVDTEFSSDDAGLDLLKKFVDFRHEMSVVVLLWHDCQLRINNYNEEQNALKVRQKWLKEDWEFFKAQRKILEQQVLRNNPQATINNRFSLCSTDAHFTETMENMLNGQNSSPQEMYCPRCSRKRCPCDECTITHMITCGIITSDQPDATTRTDQTAAFPGDSARYVFDVTPPSVSSTASSSSPSPVPSAQDATINDIMLMDPSPRNDSVLVKGGEVVAGSSNDESVCAGNFCEREIRFDEQDDEEDDDEGDDEIDDDGEDDNVDADDGVVQDEKTYQQSFNLAFSSRRLGQAIVPVVMSPDVFWSATLIQHHQQQQLLGGIAGQPLEGIQQTVPVVGTPCACYHCVLPVQPEIHVGQEQSMSASQTTTLSLPPPPPPLPAQLHLYPHMHSSLQHNISQHVQLPHTHTPYPPLSQHRTTDTLDQPQLYHLHDPRIPLNIDFDDQDGMQDHLVRAYGDWDNSLYDTTRLLGIQQPDFISPVGQDHLMTIPVVVSSGVAYDLPSTIAPVVHFSNAQHFLVAGALPLMSSNSFKTVGFAAAIPPAFQVSLVNGHTGSLSCCCTAAVSHRTAMSAEMNVDVASTSMLSVPPSCGVGDDTEVYHTAQGTPAPPCSRPETLGGNNDAASSCRDQRAIAQPCKRYTGTAVSCEKAGKAVGLPANVPSSQCLNSPWVVEGGGCGAEGGGLPCQFSATNNMLTCSHSHSVHGTTSNYDSVVPSLSTAVTSAGCCLGNGGVGTLTSCTTGQICRHSANCVSASGDQDSEKSSSSSASNVDSQREGKYCDCCYCEFFGHGNPPMSQTSRNYAEMRERLRRIRKQRNEARQDKDVTDDDGVVMSGKGMEKQHSVEDLDRLLQFIEGTDPDDLVKETHQSSKSAKRARQKLRKMEEQRKRQVMVELEIKLAGHKLNNAHTLTSSVTRTAETQASAPHRQMTHSTQSSPLGSNVTQAIVNGDSSVEDDKEDKIAGQSSVPVASGGRPSSTEYTPSSAPRRGDHCVSVMCNGFPKGDAYRPFSGLIERPVQHCRSAVISPFAITATHLPTLGGQPNSPTAKRAKRRLAIGGGRGTGGMLLSEPNATCQPSTVGDNNLRKEQAKMEVEEQLKQVEEYACIRRRQITEYQKHHRHLTRDSRHVMLQRALQDPMSQSLKEQVNQTASVVTVGTQSGAATSLHCQRSSPRDPASQSQHAVLSRAVDVTVACRVTCIQAVAHTSPVTCQPVLMTVSPSWLGGRTLVPSSNGFTRMDGHDRMDNSVGGHIVEQMKSMKPKGRKKKKGGQDRKGAVDEVFMPRPEEELEMGDMDEADRDIEKFKRFVLENPSPAKERQKLDINLNMKDIRIFSKRKSTMGCT